MVSISASSVSGTGQQRVLEVHSWRVWVCSELASSTCSISSHLLRPQELWTSKPLGHHNSTPAHSHDPLRHRALTLTQTQSGIKKLRGSHLHGWTLFLKEYEERKKDWGKLCRSCRHRRQNSGQFLPWAGPLSSSYSSFTVQVTRHRARGGALGSPRGSAISSCL